MCVAGVLKVRGNYSYQAIPSCRWVPSVLGDVPLLTDRYRGRWPLTPASLVNAFSKLNDLFISYLFTSQIVLSHIELEPGGSRLAKYKSPSESPHPANYGGHGFTTRGLSPSGVKLDARYHYIFPMFSGPCSLHSPHIDSSARWTFLLSSSLSVSAGVMAE